MASRIQEYQLSDSKRGLWTIAILHLLFGFILLFPEDTFLLSLGRPQLCLVIALGSVLLYRFYGGANHWVNLSWVVVYGVLLIVEWQAFGLPNSPVPSPGGPTVSKGFLLELFLHFLPFLYAAFRILGLMLFIPIIFAAHRLASAVR